MHVIYFLGRLYPYWAIPAIVILVEVGIFFKRKNHRIQYYFWGSTFMLGLGLLGWFIFRGDKFSDEWIRTVVHWIEEVMQTH